MTPFISMTTQMIALPQDDIDTDQIIPARYLTVTDRNGLADGAFHDWRFTADGAADPASPFANTSTSTHQVILAGENFGCGSSREHAPWALQALGIRAIISTQIADIFTSNALKNGILTIEVSDEDYAYLMSHSDDPVHIDLEDSVIRINNHVASFTIEPFARQCLLAGQEPLDILFTHLPQIEQFEQRMGR